jgi:diguanylate cyclase (GGDEF)-like protein
VVVLAAFARIWPLGGLGVTQPWLTFFPAVFVCALYGGAVAGLIATAVACLAVGWLEPLVMAEPFLGTPADGLGMSVFMAVGAAVSGGARQFAGSRPRLDAYDALVKSLDEGFCIIEMIHDGLGRPIDYRFTEVNAAFETHTGLKSAKGRTIREIAPGLEGQWFEIYGKVARTGESIRFEYPYDGMGRYLDVFAFRIGGRRSERIGLLFRDISNRKRFEQQLLTDARHDKLTDLPNRAQFQEALVKAIARADKTKRRLALLFVDVDDFKLVNDTFGHAAGDEVLRIIARRLTSCVRAGDVVCRLGGDEFTIILEGCPEDRLTVIAEQIIRSSGTPVDIEGGAARVSASVGIVTYPSAGADEASLMRNADAAMYEAKRAGKSNFRFWRPAPAETPSPVAATP